MSEPDPCLFPLERRLVADAWLREQLGLRFETMVAVMIEYHRMGGQLDLWPAGLRAAKYDTAAMRQYQRRRRARLKEQS